MDLTDGGGQVQRNVKVLQALDNVSGQTAGVGHQLADGFHLCALQSHTAGHDQADVAGAQNDHFPAHHVALAVDELLGGACTENTGRTGARDVQCAAAALPAAHGQDDGFGLNFQQALPVLGGDYLIRCNRSDSGFIVDLDVSFQHFLLVNIRIFRAGQFTAQLVQAKACMNALAEDAADVRLSVQNDHVGAAHIVSRHCSCHTGGTAADDDDIVIQHFGSLLYSFPIKGSLPLPNLVTSSTFMPCSWAMSFIT